MTKEILSKFRSPSPSQILSERQIMNRIYQDLCGFNISSPDAKIVNKSKGSAVYGEINHQAMNRLLAYLELNNKDIFYDLGSGAGKVIIQTLLASCVKHAIGIELSQERFNISQEALRRAEIFCPGIKSRGEFKNTDLLTADLSKATVIYTCSTAFSESFMRKLAKKLANLPQAFRLVSLQELNLETNFNLINRLKLDMSWTRKATVHVYQHPALL